MDVYVHANSLDAESKTEYQVCCFATDSREGNKLVPGVGHGAVVPVFKNLTDFADVSRLCTVKTGGIDKLGDAVLAELEDRLCCGRVLEQALGSRERNFVSCPQADYRRDENFKRIGTRVRLGNAINTR